MIQKEPHLPPTQEQSSARWWYLLICLTLSCSALLLPHCNALPACTSDSDCAPFVCLAQQCVAPSETPATIEPNADAIEPSPDTTSEPPRDETTEPRGEPDDATDAGTDVSVDTSPDVTVDNATGDNQEQPPENALLETPPDVPPNAKWDEMLRCAGRWVSSLKDPKHCGACNNACPSGQRCCGGTCGTGSPEICDGKDNNCDGRIDEDTKDCVLTFAGTDILKDGPALWTPLSGPVGLTIDKNNNLYIAERNRFRVRKLSPDGRLTTIAGNGTYSTVGSPPNIKVSPLTISLQGPTMLHIDPAGEILYVAQNIHGNLWRFPLPGPGVDTRALPFLITEGIMDFAFVDNKSAYLTTFIGSKVVLYDFSQGKAKWIAGNGSGANDGPIKTARLYNPNALLFDQVGKGNLYISESAGHKIRKIDLARGLVETHAGQFTPGNVNGPSSRASFNQPRQMVRLANGEIYVADAANHQLRKVTINGHVSTYAGTIPGYKDGKHFEAQFFWPTGLARDALGNLFIADTGNQMIRKLDPQGNVTTVAGALSFRNHPLHQIQLNEPKGLAFGLKGELYVADSENQRVLKIQPSGQMQVIHGSSAQPLLRIRTPFSRPGPSAIPSHAYQPISVAVDDKGGLAIGSNFDNRVLRIFPNGKAFVWGFTGSGATNGGSWKTATTRHPRGLAFAKDGSLYLTDAKYHRLRVIDPKNETLTNLAGTGRAGSKDGVGLAASFNTPHSLLMDEARNRLFIADAGNHLIRVYDIATKTISRFAGSTKGYKDSNAPTAQFNYPTGLGWGPQKKAIYIADRNNNCIRKISLKSDGSADTVSTFLGNKRSGKTGGPTTNALFSFPTHLRWGPDGKLYISDTGNHLIRVYNP